MTKRIMIKVTSNNNVDDTVNITDLLIYLM